MTGLTFEEKQQAYQYALNGADFMFEPTTQLCNKIALGCPEAVGINDIMTSIILQGKPIRLDSDMIKKYCKGVLDEKNTWLFDNANIKCVPKRFKKEVKLKADADAEQTKKEDNLNE